MSDDVRTPDFLTLPGRPPKPRQAGITHVIDKGLSVREAAEALGIPEATLRTHAARGLRLLQAALGSSTTLGGTAPIVRGDRAPKV